MLGAWRDRHMGQATEDGDGNSVTYRKRKCRTRGRVVLSEGGHGNGYVLIRRGNVLRSSWTNTGRGVFQLQYVDQHFFPAKIPFCGLARRKKPILCGTLKYESAFC